MRKKDPKTTTTTIKPPTLPRVSTIPCTQNTGKAPNAGSPPSNPSTSDDSSPSKRFTPPVSLAHVPRKNKPSPATPQTPRPRLTTSQRGHQQNELSRANRNPGGRFGNYNSSDRQYSSHNRNDQPRGGGRFGNYRRGRDTTPDYYGPSTDQRTGHFGGEHKKHQPTADWGDHPTPPIPHFSPNKVNHPKANPGSYQSSANWGGLSNLSNDGRSLNITGWSDHFPPAFPSAWSGRNIPAPVIHGQHALRGFPSVFPSVFNNHPIQTNGLPQPEDTRVKPVSNLQAFQVSSPQSFSPPPPRPAMCQQTLCICQP
jgi:hypothetical protein